VANSTSKAETGVILKVSIIKQRAIASKLNNKYLLQALTKDLPPGIISIDIQSPTK
jgi:hypothetical protein